MKVERRDWLAGLAAGTAGTAAVQAVAALQAFLGSRTADASAQVASEVAERARVAEGLAEHPRDVAVHRRFSLAGRLIEGAGGLGLGLAYGLARPHARRVPVVVAGAGIGLASMAVAQATAVVLGVSDPREWPPSGWAADLSVHAAFGLTTALVYEALAHD